jgi:GABA permease
VGDSQPFDAIMDILGDEQFDEIIVSTFPPGISRWLKADLIRRLERATDIPVTHLIANRDK